MIYTLTTNPSVDYYMELDDFEYDRVNRSSNEKYYVGGKGINVSIVLKELGCPSTALGFFGGFTGHKLMEMLTKLNVGNDFIEIADTTRLNVKLLTDTDSTIMASEINASGPAVSDAELEMLYRTLDKVKAGDILVLCGSIAPTIKNTLYADIISQKSSQGVLCVLDTTRSNLLGALQFKPFLIKPNIFELEEIFGVRITSTDEIFKYASELNSMGAQNVIVSLGGDGAVLVGENQRLYARVPSASVKNTVGAGDSMIAGFLYGYTKNLPMSEAFRCSCAAGTATAFSQWLCSLEDFKAVLEKVQIEKK